MSYERKNLAAFTLPTGQYPAFVSVNRETSPECSVVTFDVRGHARQEVTDGPVLEGKQMRVVMTIEEYRTWLRELIAYSHADGIL